MDPFNSSHRYNREQWDSQFDHDFDGDGRIDSGDDFIGLVLLEQERQRPHTQIDQGVSAIQGVILLLVAIFLCVGLSVGGSSRARRADTTTSMPSIPLKEVSSAVSAEWSTPTLVALAPTSLSSANASQTRLSQPLPSGEVVPTLVVPAARGEVLVERLNLRSGPGTAYRVVRVLSKGETFRIVGRNNANSEWWRVRLKDGTAGWISASQLYVQVANADNVPVVGAPQALSPQSPKVTQQPSARWILVADSTVDFPGPLQNRMWWYLWSDGRNNFRWQDMSGGDNGGCYRPPNDIQIEVCRDIIKTDSAGDLAVQWKAQRGGTYRFEWDSPAFLFYKHADLVGSQGKGTELPYSAVIKDVIDWEMFFWVAREDTPYHIRVFELQQ
jgi:hypothetical protein